jgi:hypothetical protein
MCYLRRELKRPGVIHYVIAKSVLIGDPLKFIYVCGIDCEHVIVHRDGETGIDVTGESDCLLAVEIAREIEPVPEVVPAVDRQKGQIDSILPETLGLSVVSDRVAGVEKVDAVDAYHVAEIGIALLRVPIEFLVFGRNGMDAYLSDSQIIVAFHRANPPLVDPQVSHRIQRAFGHDKQSALRLCRNSRNALRIDMVGVVVRAEDDIVLRYGSIYTIRSRDLMTNPSWPIHQILIPPGLTGVLLISLINAFMTDNR